jgi:isochorismate synthase
VAAERPVEVHVQPIDAPSLLRLVVRDLPLQVAWFEPAEAVWAVGFGIADAAANASSVQWNGQPQPPCGPWFGGWAFDGQRNWAGFPSERWVLPKVLVWKDRLRVWVAVFGENDLEAHALISQVREVEPHRRPESVVARGSDRQHWNTACEAAIELLASERCSKVVLARSLAVAAEHDFHPHAVLKWLEAHNPSSSTFLFRGTDGSAFVGATPEVLCRSNGKHFWTEALAGTSTVGDEGALFAPKNRVEHQAVVDAVKSTVAKYATISSEAAHPSIKRANHVIHLQTPIEGQLHDGVDALDIARLLHPTPAVAGTPRDLAIEFLRRHEAFVRGWYAGAIGHRSERHLDLRVGLRSALISGRSAEVFVGAGFVKGSTADAEWAETSAKAKVMLDALGVNP